MLQNKDIETLRMLFSSHNYVMTTAELTASKLYYADIKQLLDEGLIERVRRGYYHWTQDYGESEVVIINRLFPDAVLCMETALFYYRYSDRNPAEWNFAIDKNVSKRRTKIDYPFINRKAMYLYCEVWKVLILSHFWICGVIQRYGFVTFLGQTPENMESSMTF